MILLENMSSQTSISRINVLPSILGTSIFFLHCAELIVYCTIVEAVGYYRKVLVASIQNVKLFTQPFNREVNLDDGVALCLSDELERCKLFNGAFIVTPQHRLSLRLKQHELDIGVTERTADNCFHDILDESDAILSHEFQLVYALGSQQELPNGRSSWKILNALLLLLSRSSAKGISSVVLDGKTTYREKTRCGSFPNLRFLSSFHGQELRLGEDLCKELLSSPSYELRWMQHVARNDKKLLIRIISDPSYGDAWSAIEANPLFEKNQGDILAARGLVAFGILFHGLEARYRVNYGLLADRSEVKLAVRRSFLPLVVCSFVVAVT
jgi:hypothetical protein